MKKVFFSVLLLTALLFAVQAAGFAAANNKKDTPTPAFPQVSTESVTREYRDEVTGKVYLTTSYARVELENADSFPALAKALTEEHSRKHAAAAAKVAGEQEKNALEYIRESGSDSSFFSIETASIRRSDAAIVSVQVDLDTWFGGVHPDRKYQGYNYDPATGKQLLLKNAVKDLKAMEHLAAAALIRLNTEEERHFDSIFLKTLHNAFMQERKAKKPEQQHIRWLMDDQGLTLLFGTYYFGSHASGPALLFIPFEGNESVFNEKYVKQN